MPVGRTPIRVGQVLPPPPANINVGARAGRSLAGVARLGLRMVPWIGIGVLAYDLYERYRYYAGRSGEWIAPAGWVKTTTCNPPVAGPALRDVSRAAWVHSCYIGQTVSNSYSTTHRHRILWVQSNPAGTLWNAKDSWEWPGALPNDANVVTWQPARNPHWEPAIVPEYSPMLDPMVIPIGIPMVTPQPIPYPLIPYLRGSPFRVEQSERHYQPAISQDPFGRDPWWIIRNRPRPQEQPRPNQIKWPTPQPGQRGQLHPQVQFVPARLRPPGRRTHERKVRDNVGMFRFLVGNVTESFDFIDALHDALPRACKAKPVWDPGAVNLGRNPYGKREVFRREQATNTYVDADGVRHRIEGYGFTPRGVPIPLDRANQNLYRKPNPYEKARAVYKCLDQIDIGEALLNLAVEKAIDIAFGRGAKSIRRTEARWSLRKEPHMLWGPAL